MPYKKKKSKPKNKGGRPKVKIDYKILDKLCAFQCTGEECASFLGMDYDTLNSHLKKEKGKGFSDYLKEKGAAGRISLRRKQWHLADGGDRTMLVWLGKQWLGQKDKSSNEHSGPNGGPIPTVSANLEITKEMTAREATNIYKEMLKDT